MHSAPCLQGFQRVKELTAALAALLEAAAEAADFFLGDAVLRSQWCVVAGFLRC